MDDLFIFLQVMFVIPTVGGSVYALMCVATVRAFSRRRPSVPPESSLVWPPVSLLKPIHGLEKNLEVNLRSACTQNYPDYQAVLSVQRLDDPALPLLRSIQHDYGTARVTVVAADSEPVVNGKVQNLIIALEAARHDVLVISDSDVWLPPDYLKAIVAPLHDPQVGYACTLYHEEALHTEQEAGAMVNAYAATASDPLVREAIALQGREETRHARLIQFVVHRYGITVAERPAASLPEPDKIERAFIAFGYTECLDSFLTFGMFKLARQSGFFPEPLFTIFDRVMEEEARHIVFFVNWVAYRLASQGQALLYSGRRAPSGITAKPYASYCVPFARQTREGKVLWRREPARLSTISLRCLCYQRVSKSTPGECAALIAGCSSRGLCRPWQT
jgi:hypothetical protein